MCSARLRSFWILCYFFTFLELMAITGLMMSGRACGQTASTGALDGTALDPTGAALPDVTILLANQETSEEQSRCFVVPPKNPKSLSGTTLRFTSVECCAVSDLTRDSGF